MSNDSVFYRPDIPVEYFTDERCHILELLNTADSTDASIARARVEPGITTKQHQVKGTVERYILLEGKGVVHIAGMDDQKVCIGDVVVIPAGVTQSITNNGDHDLVFLCVCTPRFEWDNYTLLESL
ncbi:MAG: cupin domain-containing protein [Gammaproteobacteria bacterium]|nr:cupin domain-containing protein [Gammaproteobacteria bacterium]MCP4091025.1 cupin domain-containing protein [Gammaproteobacteria bacterium]MCP4277449.1 cupin domain-containing protein [Gammaproteobacteria bacterium]MCP4831490.1 cupin domain-containing protein [Gammaproteobacteria bacterium]MCP4927713.1 cupin domain-containing protein [Gammaproteobacteria bacterium]